MYAFIQGRKEGRTATSPDGAEVGEAGRNRTDCASWPRFGSGEITPLPHKYLELASSAVLCFVIYEVEVKSQAI